jgi:hypothetical protein
MHDTKRAVTRFSKYEVTSCMNVSGVTGALDLQQSGKKEDDGFHHGKFVILLALVQIVSRHVAQRPQQTSLQLCIFLGLNVMLVGL